MIKEGSAIQKNGTVSFVEYVKMLQVRVSVRVRVSTYTSITRCHHPNPNPNSKTPTLNGRFRKELRKVRGEVGKTRIRSLQSSQK